MKGLLTLMLVWLFILSGFVVWRMNRNDPMPPYMEQKTALKAINTIRVAMADTTAGETFRFRRNGAGQWSIEYDVSRGKRALVYSQW